MGGGEYNRIGTDIMCTQWGDMIHCGVVCERLQSSPS
jgi:hypothetical protein